MPAPEGATLPPQEQLGHLHRSPKAPDIEYPGASHHGHKTFAYTAGEVKHHALASSASKTTSGPYPEGRNQGIMHTSAEETSLHMLPVTDFTCHDLTHPNQFQGHPVQLH